MKKSVYLFSVVLFALAMFFTSPAKAEPVKKPEPAPTALPINNGISFLMVASVVIGVTVVSKTRSAKTAGINA